MSSQSIAKLPPAVKSLVEATFPAGQASGSAEESQVSEWIEKIGDGKLAVAQDALKVFHMFPSINCVRADCERRVAPG